MACIDDSVGIEQDEDDDNYFVICGNSVSLSTTDSLADKTMMFSCFLQRRMMNIEQNEYHINKFLTNVRQAKI